MSLKPTVIIIACLAIAAPAFAHPTFLTSDGPTSALATRWMSTLTFLDDRDAAPATLGLSAFISPTSGQRPKVFEYSEGYQTRLKIHRIASYATIPLFVAEGVVGQQLYNSPTPGKKTAHLWIATGIGVLFGLNTVTGIWNLTEASQDPNGKTLRMTHSILMLAADAGFFATAVTGPGKRYQGPNEPHAGSASLHRTLAYTSITMATVGYVIMLFGHH